MGESRSIARRNERELAAEAPAWAVATPAPVLGPAEILAEWTGSVEEAERAIERLRQAGFRIVYLTDESSLTKYAGMHWHTTGDRACYDFPGLCKGHPGPLESFGNALGRLDQIGSENNP